MIKDICCLPRSQGGLNMIDLDLAIKVQRIKWVLRILQTPRNGLWKQEAIQNIKGLDSRFGIEFFALKVNDSSCLLNKVKITPCYKKIILDFQEMRRKAEVDDHRQIIWCNRKIIFNGQLLAGQNWNYLC